MVNGISFHNGSKKLEMNPTILNQALDFPSDYHLKDSESVNFFKNFQRDVCNIEDKLDEIMKKYYEESISSIMGLLLNDDEDANNVRTSVFASNNSVNGLLKTVLIQWNFSDVIRLINELKMMLKKSLSENEEIGTSQIVVISETDHVNMIIDKILQSKANRIVLVVQQYESLESKFLESVISQIYNNEQICGRISHIRLLVCLSTSFVYFNTTCSMDCLNLLDIHHCKSSHLDKMFGKMISGNLYSGELLKYMRNKFHNCDYSVSSLIREIKYSILQKYIKNPLWRLNNDNKKACEVYWNVLNLFRNQVLLGKVDEIDLHINIQTDTNYWDNLDESNLFKKWTQIFEYGSLESVENEVQNLVLCCAEIDGSFCEKLEDMLLMAKKAKVQPANVTDSPSTPKTKAKSLNEFRKQQNEILMARINDPVKKFKMEILKLIKKFFADILKPFPSTWSNVIEIGDWNCLTKFSLDPHDEQNIEESLLSKTEYENEPLAVAWRTLLDNKKFKTVPLEEWMEVYSKNINVHKNDVVQSFYAAVGQLELLGLIRGNVSGKSTSVRLLYHPIMVMPLY